MSRDPREIAREVVNGWLPQPVTAKAATALADAFAAAIEKDRAERWLPIETAPKNGTPFLAYGAPYRYLARWSKKWGKFACDYDGDPPAEEYAPTHWQPLPSPPQEAQP